MYVLYIIQWVQRHFIYLCLKYPTINMLMVWVKNKKLGLTYKACFNRSINYLNYDTAVEALLEKDRMNSV